MTQNNHSPEQQATVLTSDAQAIAAAHHIAEQAKSGAVERDQQRIYPLTLLNQFTQLGLGIISVPKQFGGAGLSFQTVA